MGSERRKKAVEVYVPTTQNPWFWSTLAVRTADEPLALTAAVKAAIAKVVKNLAVRNIRAMDEIARESSEQPRFRARLLSGFALVALALAAAGVFGVLAFSIAQRTREFGIRMALGAQTATVLGVVLVRGVKIAAAGVALGMAGAAALSRSAGTLLFGIGPLDPIAFGGAAALLAAVAVAAAVLPACARCA